jgi:tripartite-type tricarboxylate transporter receptor subunit TctC
MNRPVTAVLVAIASTLALGIATPGTASAQQNYPNKPIRLVVPYAAGGATDIIARAIAPELSKELGQPVVVENRAGAGGNVGAEAVARSQPDGYTMVMSANSLHAITPFLYARLSYDPNKDLVPVSAVGAFVNVLVVNPNVKANSVQELIALAKAQPGKLTCASSGSGSTIHMSCEMFKQMLKLDIAHIPYKGSGPAIADLIGGHVDMMFDNAPSAMSHIRSGKLRALATTGAKRVPSLPDLPTIAEAGVAGYESSGWFGLAMPAGTPKAIVDRVSAAVQKGVKSPDFVKRMTDLDYQIMGTTAEQMGALIQDELKRWGPIVKASGAKAD